MRLPPTNKFAGLQPHVFMKVAVLADSGCQIEINGDHPGLYIVPLCVTKNNKTYLDQIEITSEQVFKEMGADKKLMVQTSQPSTGEMVKVFEKIKAGGYDHVIGIPIATGLSSTMNGMRVAADMVELPITLFDSKGTALQQRVLAETAVKLVNEGKSIDEIISVLTDIRDHSGTIIMVPNLEHLGKSGRITPTVAKLAGLLKIIPVMELNYDLGGKIDSLAKVRTLKKATKKLADRCIEQGAKAKGYKFAVEHVLAPEYAQDVVDYLEKQLGKCDVLVRELPAMVGAHMGVGGVGIQFVKCEG